MAFQDPWTPAYEGTPADSEVTNLGASRIRDLKVNVRERGGTDHSWGDTLDNGYHNQVSFNVASADPTANAALSFLYSKDAADGRMELFYEDSSGSVLQITAAGALNLPPPFPSGTRLIFPQASPPSTWSFVSGWGDRVLRFVDDGTGGQTGGSWTVTGLSASASLGSMTASSSSVPTGSGVATGTVDGHSITQAELPPHSHNFTINTGGTGNGSPESGQYNAAQEETLYTTDNGPGNGIPHTHTFTGAVSLSLQTTTTTSLGGAPSVSVSQNGSWRPQYANAVLGQKN